MAIDIDALIAEAQAYHDSVKPIEVEVLLGGRVVTAKFPYIRPADFRTFTATYPPVPGVHATGWWDGDQVARNYPDVVLIDGDEVDDLLVIRDKQVHYRWPEVWDALDGETHATLRAVIWGLYVYEPQQLAKKTKAAHHG